MIKKYWLLFLLFTSACASDSDNDSSDHDVQRLRIQQETLITSDNLPVVLKGLNWGWWGTAQPGDAAAAVEMRANVIRMPFRWYFGGEGSDIRQTGAPGNIKPEGLVQLDQYVNWCSQNKIWIILFAGSDQGAGDNDENYWTNVDLRNEFISTWKFIVNRYKDTPYIAAYEILSEPHPKKPATGIDVRLFYEELIREIRTIDPVTPVMIGPNDHYDINSMEDIYIAGDTNIIYTFNFYLPTDYIKPDKRVEAGLPIVSYPSDYIDFDGNEIHLDKDYLSDVLQPALQFRDAHHVPILVNQVGVRSHCPGHLQYIKDVGDIFYENEIPFTYWTYRTRDDATEYGLYWFDKTNGEYVAKPDEIELLTSVFEMQ
jgi:hypothetical protein